MIYRETAPASERAARSNPRRSGPGRGSYLTKRAKALAAPCRRRISPLLVENSSIRVKKPVKS
jgi:hypothetical protein